MFFLLAGSIMLAMLDLSMGSFLTLIIGKVLHQNPIFWHYLLGAFFCVSPDFDLIYFIVRKTKINQDHHGLLTHRPIIGIPAAVLIGFMLGGKFTAILAGVCIFTHYLHDTEGFGGGGLAWFWPFSSLYYSPFRITKPEKSVMKMDFKDGLSKFILSPTKKSVIETILTSIFIGIVIGFEFNLILGCFIAAIIGLAICAVWINYAQLNRA